MRGMRGIRRMRGRRRDRRDGWRGLGPDQGAPWARRVIDDDNRPARPRLCGPSRARSPSRATTSRSAPSAAATTSRSVRPGVPGGVQGRPRRSAAASTAPAVGRPGAEILQPVPGIALGVPPAEQPGRRRRAPVRHPGFADVEQHDLGRLRARVRTASTQAGQVPSTSQTTTRMSISLSALTSATAQPPMTWSENHSASTAGTSAAGTGDQTQPGELPQIDAVVVLLHDTPPQQGGQGSGVGEVGADVDPQEHGEHRAGAGRWRPAAAAPGPRAGC